MFPNQDRERQILVIDDDEMLRHLLFALLEANAYQVTCCASGEEALGFLKNGLNPSIILTDLQMAGLEGTELIAALRTAAVETPVLLGMSATVPSAELRAQLDEFLLKPFDMLQFEQALEIAQETYLQRSSAATTFVASPPGERARLSHTQTDATVVPVLDDAILNALSRTLQRSQMRELYLLTLNDVSKRFQRIRQSAEAGDLGAVQREAHAIKGSCGMVGARELQALATALEGGTTLNTSTLSDFPAACDRLRRMLDEKLQLS